ncbi:hypothetical protein G9A89_012282 [Geosiphon pyriformis]|nr:hypothetical protein G9A89_012282 [Geosiphon pyriformis]
MKKFQQQSGANQQWTVSTNLSQYPNQASYLGLIENQGFDKSTLQTKSNIPPAIITEDTTLATIFFFNINNLNTHSLFSRAAINQDKPIMALYTNARVGEIDIKLILDSGSAGSIITKQLMDQLDRRVDCTTTAQIITADGNTKTPIGEIDNFSFEINGIQIPTKVLVMEATQYQALVGNDWLSKTNTILDWNTQELPTLPKRTTEWIYENHNNLQKAILKATIKHYMNKAMITDTYGFTGAQF